MAASVVQSKKGYFTGNSTTVSFDSNVTAGNTILVTLHGYDMPEGISTPVSDSLSNSYSRKFHTSGGDGALVLSFNFADDIAGGACTITINPEGTAAYCSYMIIELGGVAAAPDDGADTNTGTGTAVSAGPITPTVSGDIIIAGMTSMASGQVSIAPDGDYTQLDEYENGAAAMHMNVQYRVYNSTTADTANWTLGSSLGWIGGMMAFKAAAGATPVTVAEGSISVSGDAVTVGVTRNLTVAEGTVSCAGDAVTLTVGQGATSLTVAEGTVSTNGDAVTLGVTGNLTVGEGSVSTAGDAVTLGVLHPLTVSEGMVSVSGDAVTLNFGLTVSLTVTGGMVSVSGDAATLGVTHLLTVGEGAVATSGDAVTVTFSGIGTIALTVAEGAVTTSGDALTVGVLHPLTVAEGTVTTTCDAVTVTYNGIGDVSLTVAEGNVSTGGDAVTLGILHPLTVAEGLIAVGGDPVTITLAALILHGARRVYQPNTRATHRAPARATLEVDDD